MKFILILFVTAFATAFVSAQTTAPQTTGQGDYGRLEEIEAPASKKVEAPAEQAPKKAAYEVVPAKRVATPAPDRAADVQPTDLKDIQKAQQEQQHKEAVQKRTGGTTPAQAPSQKEQAPVTAPKE